jgi:hypothetical protein
MKLLALSPVCMCEMLQQAMIFILDGAAMQKKAKKQSQDSQAAIQIA